jgi:uncharacterized repeat protein (TIGR03847 family)
MSRQLHVFDRPRRFVTGTVGTPGDRTFYLQAVDGNRIVSVALEKQQVMVLADRLEQLLDDVVSGDERAVNTDAAALEQPVDEEFRVNAMGLAWDGDSGLIVIEAQAPAEDLETAQETRVVAAGRPPCPLCSLPLNPEGHVCPRHNGYRRGAVLDG